jgi:hypothetical protein
VLLHWAQAFCAPFLLRAGARNILRAGARNSASRLEEPTITTRPYT